MGPFGKAVIAVGTAGAAAVVLASLLGSRESSEPSAPSRSKFWGVDSAARLSGKRYAVWQSRQGSADAIAYDDTLAGAERKAARAAARSRRGELGVWDTSRREVVSLVGAG